LQVSASGVQTDHYTGVSFTNTATNSTAAKTKTGLSISSTGTWGGTGSLNRGLYVNVANGSANQAAIFLGGNVGIGTLGPATMLHVEHANATNNGLSITNAYDATKRWHFNVSSSLTDQVLRLYFNNDLRGSFSSATGGYTTPSDSRLKKNVSKLSGVLNKVMNLEIVEYNFIDQKSDMKYMGLIAQDVEKLFPSLVCRPDENEDGEKYYTLDYSGTGVVALKAIQEQQLLIEKLTEENNNLKSRLDKLEQLILNK
jgi:hypothetical protein